MSAELTGVAGDIYELHLQEVEKIMNSKIYKKYFALREQNKKDVVRTINEELSLILEGLVGDDFEAGLYDYYDSSTQFFSRLRNAQLTEQEERTKAKQALPNVEAVGDGIPRTQTNGLIFGGGL